MIIGDTMRTCNYCGRKLKQFYANCPGCGSNSFSEDDLYPSVYVIEKPPMGGYHVEDKFFRDKRLAGVVFVIFGIMLAAAVCFYMIPKFQTYDIGPVTIIDEQLFRYTRIAQTIILSIPSLICLIIGINYLWTSAKELGKIKHLANNGVLVKNIPYILVRTGELIDNKQVYAISVKYKNPATNEEVDLRSNAKYDGRLYDKDGTADLLYDPEDFSNYYIDIEIY